MTVLRLAIAGLGTVGAGLVRLVEREADLLALRAGCRIEIVDVSARERGRDRGVALDRYRWHDDAVAMARNTDADVVVELIGGSDGPAKAVCEAALAAGRHVVTANKALLAHHGADLARAAESAGAALCYEAAVAGGIPAIKAVREGFAGNEIQRVMGILNGTCNYMLSDMRRTGRDFATVLKEAQDLGYAEADPSFDIDGVDAAHKLAILASLAFGVEVDLAAVHVEGIRSVSALDIAFAEELGYRIKLLGIARQSDAGLEQRVHPCMVPVEAPIAHVDGVLNAVVVEGSQVGRAVLEGPGAGAGPTASAVAADIIDIARGNRAPAFGVPAAALQPLQAAPMAAHRGAYYIRLMVVDRPRVLASVASSLGAHGISIESVLQRGRAPEERVPVVIVTHETEERELNAALGEIANHEAVAEPPLSIRIEAL